MKQQRCVAVVGGGVMGGDIASIFFAHGWGVQVVEPNPATRARLPESVPAAGKVMGLRQSGGSVRVWAQLSDIQWPDVDIVIECAPEDLAVKQQIFQALDRSAPTHVPLTSNSSGLPISRIGEGCGTHGRMLGLHFFMPAHLVPAVEVIRSEFSDEAVAQTVSSIMSAVGKKPVQVKRDAPGFLANRIQHALMREAIALVDEGFASAEDVDLAVRYGFGFRYIAAGPLLQKDLGGIDINYAASATIYPHLHCNTEPSKLVRDLVENGHFGVKSASRKGFYEWNEDSIKKEQKRYQSALLKAMQILRDEDDAEAASAV